MIGRRQVLCSMMAATLAGMGWGSHVVSAAEETGWLTDIKSALQIAGQQHRPVLVFVSMDGCHYCQKMAKTTLSDGQIQKALGQAYVTVTIKGPDHPDLMRKLKIRSFPTTLLATSDGEIVDQLTGYTDSASLYQHLRTAWQQEQVRLASVQPHAQSQQVTR